MTTKDLLAQSYLVQAEFILSAAGEHVQQQAWNLVVRRCQEAVEMATKGLLRFLCIEVPREHDVGPLLLQYADRLPVSIRSEVETIVRICANASPTA